MVRAMFSANFPGILPLSRSPTPPPNNTAAALIKVPMMQTNMAQHYNHFGKFRKRAVSTVAISSKLPQNGLMQIDVDHLHPQSVDKLSFPIRVFSQRVNAIFPGIHSLSNMPLRSMVTAS
jgi:hypothetical protein